MTNVLSNAPDRLLDTLGGCGLSRDGSLELIEYVSSGRVRDVTVRGAILGGSRAFGLGNAHSDVDVVMLVDRTPTEPGGRGIMIDRHAVHVEGLTDEDVSALAARFRRPHLPLTNLTPVANKIVQTTRAMTEITAGVVLAGETTVSRLRATLPREHVPGLVAESFAALQGGVHRDAAGALRSGDWATAVEAALIALDYAVQAAVAATGDVYVPRKFLARRAQRLDQRLFDLFQGERLRLVEAAAGGATSAVPAVERALRVAAGIVAGPVLGWAASPVTTGAGAVRSAHFCVARYEDGFLITGSTDHPVSRAVAETWMAHDGRSRLDVVGLLAARWERPVAKVAPFVDVVAGHLERAALLEHVR